MTRSETRLQWRSYHYEHSDIWRQTAPLTRRTSTYSALKTMTLCCATKGRTDNLFHYQQTQLRAVAHSQHRTRKCQAATRRCNRHVKRRKQKTGVYAFFSIVAGAPKADGKRRRRKADWHPTSLSPRMTWYLATEQRAMWSGCYSIYRSRDVHTLTAAANKQYAALLPHSK